MRRNTLNFMVDAISLLVMFAMIATGLVIRFILPPGSGGRGHGGGGLSLWGWGRHEWGDLHFWLAAGLASLLLVHVALHWAWVCVVARGLVSGRDSSAASAAGRRRDVYGAGLLGATVAAFAGFLWLANGQVEQVRGESEAIAGIGAGGSGGAAGQACCESESTGRSRARPTTDRHGAGQAGGAPPSELHEVRGSMSLREAASLAGVDAATLGAELGLPANVSPDERLGRLRQAHGLSMEAIRDRVAAHRTGGASAR